MKLEVVWIQDTISHNILQHTQIEVVTIDQSSATVNYSQSSAWIDCSDLEKNVVL